MEFSGSLADIKRYGSKCLREISQEVPVPDPETSRLLDQLWQTLGDDNGVGLAAPQIGVAKRVFIVYNPTRPAGSRRMEIVNPVLKKTFGNLADFEEGCLSFPGLYFDVKRRTGAVVEYFDRDGKRRRISDDAVVARILQHELDHLDGVLYIDRIPGWRRVFLWPRLLICRLGQLRTNRGDGR